MRRPSNEWAMLPEDFKGKILLHQEQWPVKIGEITQEFGLLVKVSTLEVGISGVIEPCSGSDSGFKISINKHEPKIRQRFTLAHELSHYLLHREFIGIGLADNVLYRSKLSDEKEIEANKLASDILMPRALLKKWVEQFGIGTPAEYVSRVAGDFNVSEEAMRIALGLK